MPCLISPWYLVMRQKGMSFPMRKRFFLNCLLILTLVVVMSTNAFAISESDVESAVSASGKEAVSGNVLVWFLCAIAFLKVSQKIDSFSVQPRSERRAHRRLHALRSNDRHARHQHRDQRGRQRIGQPQPSRFCACIREIWRSEARHAAGFFSGGLVGMASRKIASDAVRTATTEKNIVQPQQAEATVSRTHASSDTHSGSQIGF